MAAVWTLLGVALAGSVSVVIQVVGNRRHTQAETDLNIVTAAKEVIGQYRQRVAEVEARLADTDRKSVECEKRTDKLTVQMMVVTRHVEQLEDVITTAGLTVPTRPTGWPT